MERLVKLMNAARTSGLKMWVLNRVLSKTIPFNAQHGFKIIEIGDHSITTFAPYEKRNFNHIRGIHACGIATIAEFASGMVLIRGFDMKKYRIIMSKLEVTYHYQAKKDLRAISTLSPETKSALIAEMDANDAVFQKMTTEIYDTDDNHVATTYTTWQLKPWAKTRTKR
jgi:acyl-coenzyme A thioesterase PaaI-like protein